MDKLQYVSLAANKINNTLLRDHTYDATVNELRAKGITVATANQKVDWDEMKITENTPKYRVLFVIAKDIDLTVPLINGSKSSVKYTLTDTDISILKEFARLYEHYTEKLSNYAVDIVVDTYITSKTITSIGNPGTANGIYSYSLWGSDIPEISNILYDYDKTIVNAYLNSDMTDYSGIAGFNGNTNRGEVFIPYNQLIYPCKSNNVPLKDWLSELKADAIDGAEVDTYVHEFIHTLEQYGTQLGKNIWEFHDALYYHEFKDIDTDYEDMFDRMGAYLQGYIHPDNTSETGIIEDIYNNSPTKKYSQLKAPESPKISANIYENNKQIKLNWNVNEDVNYYRIYRSTSKNKGYSLIAKTETNSYQDTNIEEGITYYYKVEAVLSSNKQVAYSKYSNIASISVPVEKPQKVKNLKLITSGSTSIKLSWEKVANTGYEIYKSTDNKKWNKVVTITKNTTVTYENKNLTSNKTYYYKVRAYKTVKNENYYGDFSDVMKIKTAPKAPKVTVSLKNYNTLTIKVASVGGASKYQIYRATSKNGKYTKVSELKKAGTFKNTKLVTGKKYYYKVRACNSNGNYGSFSNIISEKVVPSTPSVTLKTTSKKVNITFKKVQKATRYEIYRATSKKGKYTKIATTKKLKYTDKTKKGKTYYYKVRVYTLVGKTKVYSNYSTIKKIKSK